MQTFNKYQTPWGTADHIKHLGGGIVAVQTSSHGGYFVPDSMMAKMPDALKCNTYGGGNWFEEDCEWALVVAAFPCYFDARSCFYAVGTIEAYTGRVDGYFASAAQWLASDAGAVVRGKAQEWKEPARIAV